MIDLTNSHSLTDFQRNARTFIEGLNESREPILLTVNGKVQAVLVDPASFQEMQERQERERFIAALNEGEQAIREGRVISAEDAYERMKAKYGL